MLRLIRPKASHYFFRRSDSRSCVRVPHIKFNGSVIELVKRDKHIDNVVGQNCSMHQIQHTACQLYGSQLCYMAIRRLLNLPTTTHCNLLPYICGDIRPNL